MDLYKLFGLTEEATDEELNAAYARLRAQYREECWQDGEAGNRAARKLTKLENAYKELTEERKRQGKNTTGEAAFEEVSRLLKEGDVNKAQSVLDEFNERNAEWHYLQAVVYYKKGWMNDSKKQLEIAMQMNPDCNKYRDAYGKLNAKADYEQKQKEGAGNQQPPYGSMPSGEMPQMGGMSMGEQCCCCCGANMCMNSCLRGCMCR
jgi:DnaJ-class molecular chaperone